MFPGWHMPWAYRVPRHRPACTLRLLACGQVDVASLMTQDNGSTLGPDGAVLNEDTVSLEVVPNDGYSPEQHEEGLPGLPMAAHSPASSSADAPEPSSGEAPSHPQAHEKEQVRGEHAHGEANAALQHWSSILLG